MLRWGLLGTARINRLLIPAIRASARSAVHAVASREPARAATYAAEWQIPHACASYDALLGSDVDIVYIPLPNSLHVPWAERALAAGKHVLCEKPLALRPEDVDRLSGAAAAAGRSITEGFMYRHHAQMRRIEAVIASGALGELRVVVAGSSYMQNRPADVRLDPALGGGALWDVGCYPVSLADALIGEAPARVTGLARVGASGVDEVFVGALTYPNGAAAQIFASFRAAYQTFARIIGTEAVLEIDRPFRPQQVEYLRLVRDGTVEPIEVRGRAIFEDEVADMEDAALGIRPPRISLAESRRVAATLQALHAAARE